MYNALHGFRGGRGLGTAMMEAKLSQQLGGLAQKPLFQVFLDIRKAYDSLYREQCLDVLSGYGGEPHLTCLINSYWERKRIAPKTVKFLSEGLWTGRG